MKSEKLKGFLARFKGRVATTTAGVVCLSAFAIVIVGHHANSNEVISAQPDTAWFSSSADGSASLLDGLTLTRAAYVQNLATSGQAVDTVQAGPNAYLVNQTNGSITWLNGELLQAGNPKTFGSASFGNELQILSNGSVSWVETGDGHGDNSFLEVDPTTLASMGRAITSDDSIQSASMAPDGILWSVDKNGEVESFQSSSVRSDTSLGYSGPSDLVMQGNDPVVITEHQVFFLSQSSGEVQSSESLTIPATSAGWIAGASSGFVCVLDQLSDHLQIFNEAGTSASVILDIKEGSTPDVLGTPVVSGGVVFVPDLTSGRVILVDASSGDLINSFPLSVGGLAYVLSLVHGFVWYDAPSSYEAGIVTVNGPEPIIQTGGSPASQNPPPPQSKTDKSGNRSSTDSTSPNSSSNQNGGSSSSTTISNSNEVTVPYVVGLSSVEAAGNLQSQGLTCDGCSGAGTVASQSPPAGKRVPFGSAVDVTLGIPRLPTVLSSTLPPAEVGQNYQGQIKATGGTGVLTFTLIPPEPDGWVSLNGGALLEKGSYVQPLNGMPSVAGTITFGVFATDAAGAQSSTVSFSITIGSNQGSDPDIYVSEPSKSAVTVVDSDNGQTVANQIPVGQDPTAIAISPDGSKAYVVNSGSNSNSVTVIDTSRNQPLGNQISVGNNPSSIAVSPDGSSVYVTNENSGTVSIINTSTEVVTTVQVGSQPDAIAISPNQPYAYVANFGSNNVSVIDTSNDSVVGTVSDDGSGPDAIAITPNGSVAYVVNGQSNNVGILNTSSDVISGPLNVGSQPSSVAVTPNGKYAYVVNSGSSSVSVITVSSNTVSPSAIGIGGSPQSIFVTPNGTTAYVTQKSSGSLSAVEITDHNALGASISVGPNPMDLSITPDQAPAASFEVSTAPAGSASTFNATGSVAPSSPIVSYYWQFGDQQTKTTSSPVVTHVYAAASNYTVKLTETDADGTSTTLVFTGQTVSLDGRTGATAVEVVPVPAAPASPASLTGGSLRQVLEVNGRRDEFAERSERIAGDHADLLPAQPLI